MLQHRMCASAGPGRSQQICSILKGHRFHRPAPRTGFGIMGFWWNHECAVSAMPVVLESGRAGSAEIFAGFSKVFSQEAAADGPRPVHGTRKRSCDSRMLHLHWRRASRSFRKTAIAKSLTLAPRWNAT